MMRRAMSFWVLVLLITVGCSNKKDAPPPTGQACNINSNCPEGQTCSNKSCTPFEQCKPDSCDSGTFCDNENTNSCVTVAQKCNATAAGCECYIANMAGQFPASGMPTLFLTGGATQPITLALAVKGGEPIPGATFTLSFDNPSSSFTVDGQTVKATTTAGNSVVKATVAGYAECEAKVVNLGASTPNKVRFFVYDEQTGEAIAGAKVIVDANGEEIQTPDSNVEGVSLTKTFSSATPYTVSVLKDGYNYISLVGLSTATDNDVVLPLSPHSIDGVTGGATGILDFATFYENYTHGPKALKAGFVASSFPLQQALNFDAASFIGPIGSCEPGHEVGCTPIVIEGFLPAEKNVKVPLPGGVVAQLSDQVLKGNFDMVGAPGRRFAWSLGLEAQFEDIGALIPLFMGDTCSCNLKVGICEGTCACDKDCGQGIDLGVILNSVTPLLSKVGIGYIGNLPLQSAKMTEWQSYTAPAYAQRPADARFPRLDSGKGTYKSLPLTDLLNKFSDVTVPNLPKDEVLGGNATMDSMLVLTGVDAKGFGFVPLGLGFGSDCTTGNCFSREHNAAAFDGKVNGGTMCIADRKNPCQIPTATEDGHLGLFKAYARGGLSDQPWTTLMLALPASSLAGKDTATNGFRAKGALVAQEITQGSSAQLASVSYLDLPNQPATVAGRSYQATAVAGAGLRWVTITNGTRRWNVYFAKGNGNFVAPKVPAGWVDPFVSAADDNTVTVTDIAVAMRSGTSLSSLIHHDQGQTLGDIISSVDRFSVRAAALPVQ
jgi:hypothetical protein